MTNRTKREQKRKILSLCVLIFVEVAFGLFTYYSTRAQLAQAYIVKNGNSYILLWKGTGNETYAKHYSYLHQALQYAQDELDMQIGKNPNYLPSVETVWSRDDIGKRMVFWTTSEVAAAQRLSFSRTYEADVYQAAFKKGAYTTSPFGHSLSLVPRR